MISENAIENQSIKKYYVCPFCKIFEFDELNNLPTSSVFYTSTALKNHLKKLSSELENIGSREFSYNQEENKLQLKIIKILLKNWKHN